MIKIVYTKILRRIQHHKINYYGFIPHINTLKEKTQFSMALKKVFHNVKYQFIIKHSR